MKGAFVSLLLGTETHTCALGLVETLGQSTQAWSPTVVFTLPDGQVSQPAPTRVNPMLHTQTYATLSEYGAHKAHRVEPAPETRPGAHAAQAVSAVLPDDERYLPASQSTHAADPTCAWCLPGTQSAQSGPPAVPAEPALHLQEETSELPAGLFPELTGHATQSASASLPVDARYLPTPQSTQTAAAMPG